MKPHIVGIAGPSGAGKSELANRLAQQLGGASVMTLDSYYRPMDDLPLEERRKSNFDLPAALEWELLFNHLGRLRAGKAIEEPIYDFTCHTRKPGGRRVEPREFVIVEGLFTLYWEEVRGALDTKVFVTTAQDTCFERRLARDVAERGRTPQSVREQYELTVRPSAETYIRPTERFADVVVSGEQSIEDSIAAILAQLQGRIAAV
ncbi:MAG: uridine kinase [Acidobacteriales bacterium]|nr:uridine kinase [Terriglobales bacterium]